MNILKVLLLPFIGLTVLFLSATSLFAGGGAVAFTITPNSQLNPGEQYVVNVDVHTQKSSPNPCNNCYIKLALQNPQSSDYIAQSSDYTDENGRIYAKVISKIAGNRTVYVTNLKDIDESDITSEAIMTANLNYSGGVMAGAPEMVYPQDGQVLDLEGSYIFRVKPVAGASGYLFGLFQNGIMVYENYRDTGYLNGTDFALWESNPAHNKFKTGEVKVMIRAMINNQWTDAREITIYLKTRGSSQEVVTTVVENSPESATTKAKLPVIQPSKTVVIVNDSSASAELQKKVEELEQKLVASQEKQSALENRLDQLIKWIKSIFPFF